MESGPVSGFKGVLNILFHHDYAVLLVYRVAVLEQN